MAAEKESSATIAQQTQQRHEQGVLELQVGAATLTAKCVFTDSVKGSF